MNREGTEKRKTMGEGIRKAPGFRFSPLLFGFLRASVADYSYPAGSVAEHPGYALLVQLGDHVALDFLLGRQLAPDLERLG